MLSYRFLRIWFLLLFNFLKTNTLLKPTFPLEPVTIKEAWVLSWVSWLFLWFFPYMSRINWRLGKQFLKSEFALCGVSNSILIDFLSFCSLGIVLVSSFNIFFWGASFLFREKFRFSLTLLFIDLVLVNFVDLLSLFPLLLCFLLEFLSDSL